MFRSPRPTAASLVLSLAVLAPPALAADNTPELRRVMLSTGGVGYFEYEASVEGDATLQLPVPLAEVDDILKSLVIYDEAGHVGSVDLPGREGGNAVFRDLPFGREALSSPLQYLNALQGVEVQVAGAHPLTGRILRAETVAEPSPSPSGSASPNGSAPPVRPATRTRVTLLTAQGLAQFVLEDVDSVQVSDPALRGRIEAALAASRGESKSETRLLTLHAPGTGRRQVRIGYVAAAPLWKTSYRLLLPRNGDKDKDKARLQAWAVFENDSGQDWRKVDLTLDYGNPVTFRQALYRSYYVERPEVPVEVLNRLLPAADTGGQAVSFAKERRAVPPPPMSAPPRDTLEGAIPPAAPAPVAEVEPMRPAAPAQEAAAAETETETVFHLAAPVDIPAGHSATLPIFDHAVSATRVDLADLDASHPYAAVRLANAGETSLPAGVLTLYDPAAGTVFAGDARLAGLPPGETRLLSFAADPRVKLATKIDSDQKVASITASEGVIHIQRRLRRRIEATLTAAPDAARDVVLDVPKEGDRTLSFDGPTPVDVKGAGIEETATSWRVPVALKAGETRRLTLFADRVEAEDLALVDQPDSLTVLVGLDGLSSQAQTALDHLVQLQRAVGTVTESRDRLVAERTTVEQDEERLRHNLAAVGATDALHGRLVKALDADETRLADLAGKIAQAEQALDAAKKNYAAGVAGLRL